MKLTQLLSCTLTLSLAAPACIHSQPALNPKFTTGQAPGPAMVLPILECRQVERATKNSRQREMFLATFPGEIWRAAGLDGEPRLDSARYTDPICEELLVSPYTTRIGYQVNPRLRTTVEKYLASTNAPSLLVIAYVFPHSCVETTATVRDRTGTAVGTVGTGRDVCEETEEVWLNAALVTPTDVVWSSTGLSTSPDYANAPATADALFAGFPRQVVAQLSLR